MGCRVLVEKEDAIVLDNQYNSSDTIYYLISFRKSAPLQKRQLNLSSDKYIL